ncbi:branched-chain amino acid ABC transporter permease [Deinococcus sp. UYEF24]
MNALSLGGAYCLVALGLTLVYGVLNIPNFAHGSLYMVGAYITWALLSALGLPYFLALGLSAVVLGILAMIMERLVFSPLRSSPGLRPMIAAVGVLFFLEAAVQLIWGQDFKLMTSPFTGIIHFGPVSITAQRLLVTVTSVVVMLALFYFLKRTRAGITIEAMAQNREGARLVGINVNRVASLTFFVSGALAAIAAALYAPVSLVSPTMGNVMNLKVFAIIVLGGMGSLPGAIAGAFLLAFAETFGGVLVGPDFADVVGFAVLVLVLSLRPQGLLGKTA